MNLKATNKTETNKYELEVEISAEDFNKALSEVAKTEGKKMSVPGFRKGHAPRSVIEKMYGENVFFEAAVDKLYRPAMQDAIEASCLEVIAVSNRGRYLRFPRERHRAEAHRCCEAGDYH